jgi:hypothetical protein
MVIRSSCNPALVWHDELDGAAESEDEGLLQRDVEEAELLELLCAIERADVDGPEPIAGCQSQFIAWASADNVSRLAARRRGTLLMAASAIPPSRPIATPPRGGNSVLKGASYQRGGD